MIEYVDAAAHASLWSAADLAADSPEDAHLFGPDTVGIGVHSGDGDGAVIIGTRAEIRAYFDRAAALLDRPT